MTYIPVQSYIPKAGLVLGILLSLLLLIVSLLLPYGWLIAALLIGLMLLGAGVHIAIRPQTLSKRRPLDTSAPRIQNSVVLADGSEQAGLLVPLPTQQPWKMVLTRNGYVLADQRDQVRYTF